MPILDSTACAAIMDALTAVGVTAALAIRQAAGEATVRTKADESPVTSADLAAEAAIRDRAARLVPGLPIISEEGIQRLPRDMENSSYLLVDPLDGTREYIEGSDEYVISIAIMTNRTPRLGIIVAPVLGLIWRGCIGRGAERMAFASDGAISRQESIHTRCARRPGCTVMVSRSHLDSQTQAYLGTLPDARAVACGSALKFCRIAEGSADLYPRFGPTRDWDVAGGHALVEAAGGKVTTPEGTGLRYGSPELIIPGFLAAGDEIVSRSGVQRL